MKTIQGKISACVSVVCVGGGWPWAYMCMLKNWPCVISCLSGGVGKYVCVCLSLCVYIYIYLPTPPHDQDATQGQFFKQTLTGLNLEFSFS